MDDWIQSFSLTIVDVVDVAFHAPLRTLLGWAIAAVLAIVMISTLAPADGQSAKVVIYIAIGLIVYAEILRPVSRMLRLDRRRQSDPWRLKCEVCICDSHIRSNSIINGQLSIIFSVIEAKRRNVVMQILPLWVRCSIDFCIAPI